MRCSQHEDKVNKKVSQKIELSTGEFEINIGLKQSIQRVNRPDKLKLQ